MTHPRDITVTVPCNGCTLCCHNDAVRLYPDEVDRYDTEPHWLNPSLRMLAHQANGDCIYLGADGCTIHDRRPRLCRTMDCRTFARMPYTRVRKFPKPSRMIAVWRRGRDLLASTTPPTRIAR